MPIIRNWRDATPYVGHETAIIWPMFRGVGAEGVGDVLVKHSKVGPRATRQQS